MSIPDPTSLPAPHPQVLRAAAGRRMTPVWVNGIGGITYRLEHGSGNQNEILRDSARNDPAVLSALTTRQYEFIKVGPHHEEFDPAAESERLTWLRNHGMPVPVVLDSGSDATHRWIHTAGLPGINAITALDDPVATVRALGAGLRVFHDSLPVEDCPFSFSVEHRVQRRLTAGATVDNHAHAAHDVSPLDPGTAHDVSPLDPGTAHDVSPLDPGTAPTPVHYGAASTSAFEHLEESSSPRVHLEETSLPVPSCDVLDRIPPLDLVVCHGDACNPNFLIEFNDAGHPQVSGYVDLGDCGVADRWADIVMAHGSLQWNFPGIDGAILLDGYGIDMDEEKFAYYTELWETA